jgi:hypothetical protein
VVGDFCCCKDVPPCTTLDVQAISHKGSSISSSISIVVAAYSTLCILYIVHLVYRNLYLYISLIMLSSIAPSFIIQHPSYFTRHISNLTALYLSTLLQLNHIMSAQNLLLPQSLPISSLASSPSIDMLAASASSCTLMQSATAASWPPLLYCHLQTNDREDGSAVCKELAPSYESPTRAGESTKS